MEKKEIVLALLFFVFLSSAFGRMVTVGISPSRIYEEHLLRGSHFEKKVYLTTDFSESSFSYDITGNMSRWIIVGTEHVAFSNATTPTPVKIAIDVPEEAELGTYVSTINFRISIVEDGLSKEIVLPLEAKAIVVNSSFEQYKINRIMIYQIGEQDIKTCFVVENTGNTEIYMNTVRIVIKDQFSTSILWNNEIELGYTSFPFSISEKCFNTHTNLTKGQYWAFVSFFGNGRTIDEKRVIFDIGEFDASAMSDASYRINKETREGSEKKVKEEGQEKAYKNSTVISDSLVTGSAVKIDSPENGGVGVTFIMLVLGVFALIIIISRTIKISSPPSFSIIMVSTLFLAFATTAKAEDIIISKVTLPNSINLIAGSVTEINCTAELFNINGYENTSWSSGVLFDINSAEKNSTDDNNNHYTNNSCVITGSGESGVVTCSFWLWYYANPSNWSCTVDAGNGVIEASNVTGNTSRIEELKALNISSIVYTNDDGGALSLGQISKEANLTIFNLGNIGFSIEVSSESEVIECTHGTIPLENERYNATSGFVFDTSAYITTVPMIVPGFWLNARTDDTMSNNSALFWRLKVPENGVGGNCTGIIIATAE
ncbi:MAG: hypothetical protein QXK37_00900 [Candidatus Woesearchaeota archaeon]